MQAKYVYLNTFCNLKETDRTYKVVKSHRLKLLSGKKNWILSEVTIIDSA